MTQKMNEALKKQVSKTRVIVERMLPPPNYTFGGQVPPAKFRADKCRKCEFSGIEARFHFCPGCGSRL